MPLTAPRLSFITRSLVSAVLLAPLVTVSTAQELYGPPAKHIPSAYAQDADTSQPVLPRVHIRRDERRTIRKLPENVGRNIIGLLAKDNLIPFAVGGAASGLAFTLDDSVQEYFEQEDRLGSLQSFGDKLGDAEVVVPVTAGVFVVGRLIDSQRFRDMSYDFLQATIVNGLIVSGLKHTIGRERPNRANTLSFPSGHSSSWFTYATVVQRHYGTWIALPVYGLWAITATSRLDNSAHYLSDVVAGAAIGYLVARTSARQNDKPLPGETERQLTVVPWVSPRESGLGVVAQLTF